MKVWECKYRIERGENSFNVMDWIYSTTEPTDETIGHYWKYLFRDTITVHSCKEVSMYNSHLYQTFRILDDNFEEIKNDNN